MAAGKKVWVDRLTERYANTEYRAISMEALVRHYEGKGERRIALVQCPPNLPPDPRLIAPELYHTIPQDHPAWLSLRGMPRWTASTMADALLMWEPVTSAQLGFGHLADKSEFSDYWQGMAVKCHCGWVPPAPLEETGPTFARWGNAHEACGLHGILQSEPTARYRDQGLTMVTKERWRALRVSDLLTPGKVFESFPVEVGASPDGLLDLPDPVTGVVKTFGVEIKTPTYFMPIRKTKYLWTQFYANKYYKPYEHPKAYYMPQIQLQAAALGVDSVYHTSWTYNAGMRSWIIDYSPSYFAHMMTLTNHLVETFLQPALARVAGTAELPRVDLPMNYFHAAAPQPVRDIYAELIAQTKAMCNAPVHKFVDGETTKAWTDAEGLATPGDDFVRFPNIPKYFPPHIKLYILAHKVPRIVPFELANGLVWPNLQRDVDLRRANVEAIVGGARVLRQFAPILRALEDPPDVAPSTRSYWTATHAVTARQEDFLQRVLRVVYEIETGRDRDTTIAAMAHASLRALAAAAPALIAPGSGIHDTVQKLLTTRPTRVAWIKDAAAFLRTLVEVYGCTHLTSQDPRGHLADIGVFVDAIDTALAGKPASDFSPLLAVIVACDSLCAPLAKGASC